MMRKKKRTQLKRIFLCAVICVWISVSFSTTVYAGNYNSWTEGSVEERNLHDSGTGSELFDENNSVGTDELIDQMTKDKSNYFEVQICKLINGLSYGIAAVERASRMQIDTIVLGRVAKNASVNSFGFDLSDGNLYGSLGSIVYTALRNFMFGVFGIYFLYMMLAYLIKGTGTSRANLKDALYNFLFVYALLYAIPIAVDYLLLFRDGMLKIFMEKALSSAEDLSFVDVVLQQATDEARILYSLLALCFVCGSVWLGFNYIKIALQQAYLFGVFPIVAFRSFSDKNILNKWFSYFFANALVPLFDCIGFVMLIYELRLNPSNSLAGQFMALVIFFSIIPSRNMLIQLFGGPVPGRGFSILPMALMAARLLGRGRGGVTPSGSTNGSGNGNSGAGNGGSGSGGSGSGGGNSGGASNGMIERTITPNSELAVGSNNGGNNGGNNISNSSFDGEKAIVSDVDSQGGGNSGFNDTDVENEKITRGNDFSEIDADNVANAENDVAYADTDGISEQYANAENVQDAVYTDQGVPVETLSGEVVDTNRMDVNDADGIQNEVAVASDKTVETTDSVPVDNPENSNVVMDSDSSINQVGHLQQFGDGVDGVSEQSAIAKGDYANIEQGSVINQQGSNTTSTIDQRGYAQGTDATVNQSGVVNMKGEGSSATIHQAANVENARVSAPMNNGGLSANGPSDALGAPSQMNSTAEQIASAQRASVDVNTTIQTKYTSQSSDPSASMGVRTAQNVGRVARGVAVAGGVAGGMMGFASTAISGNANTVMGATVGGAMVGGAPGSIVDAGANKYIRQNTPSEEMKPEVMVTSNVSVRNSGDTGSQGSSSPTSNVPTPVTPQTTPPLSGGGRQNLGISTLNRSVENQASSQKNSDVQSMNAANASKSEERVNGDGYDSKIIRGNNKSYKTEEQSRDGADLLMGNKKRHRK